MGPGKKKVGIRGLARGVGGRGSEDEVGPGNFNNDAMQKIFFSDGATSTKMILLRK